MDEYDLKLEENTNQNRHTESISLFAAITGHSIFHHMPFMLFLNKTDLFKKKIEKQPLSRFFSTYEDYVSKHTTPGATQLDYAKKFMRSRFSHNFKGAGRLFVHYTNALDTENCRKVFDSVRDDLVHNVTQMYAL